jgi:hypothetical protein
MDVFGGILGDLEHFVDIWKCVQKKNVDIARSQDAEVSRGLNKPNLMDFLLYSVPEGPNCI